MSSLSIRSISLSPMVISFFLCTTWISISSKRIFCCSLAACSSYASWASAFWKRQRHPYPYPSIPLGLGHADVGVPLHGCSLGLPQRAQIRHLV
ncbi:hypothetical protein EYF80_012050 [Liparis tanakae]|uniref:Uncharacterized protein n=1 Tax=Liparis tanakae TaxID=230148 RepID=A0A4Z2IKJ8_9TELE|nr:hypothetical protein EYF80_012050 [Liparis tanakae]